MMLLTYARDNNLTVKETKILGKLIVKYLVEGKSIDEITEPLKEEALNSIMPTSKMEWHGIRYDNTAVRIVDTLTESMLARCKYVCLTKPRVEIIKNELF